MKRLNTPLLFLTVFLVSIHPAHAETDARYKLPIRAELVLIQVYVAEPAKVTVPQLQQMLQRKSDVLGAEIVMHIHEYLPRGLSPVLLIDEEPAAHRYRIIDSNDRITTVGFLLDNPDMLKEGGRITVQYGEDSDTRSASVATVSLDKAKILGMDSAKRAGIVLEGKRER